ncbi:hypothetical protein LINGRAHAP2_LOCUS32707 [Linum grandiflorum]
MHWRNGIAEYRGGLTFPYHIFKEDLTVRHLTLMTTFDLKYDSLDKLWYMWPGMSMGNGIHEIDLEEEVLDGLLVATSYGDVHVYMECAQNDDKFVGDNMTNGFSEHEVHEDLDDSVNQSIGQGGLIHLIDDSDRTTDPEFYEAMDKLGVPGYRKKMRSRRTLDGWEVSQIYSEDEPAIEGHQWLQVNLLHQQQWLSTILLNHNRLLVSSPAVAKRGVPFAYKLLTMQDVACSGLVCKLRKLQLVQGGRKQGMFVKLYVDMELTFLQRLGRRTMGGGGR